MRVLRPGGCLLRCWNYKTGPFDDLYRIWRAHTPDPKRDYFRGDRHLKAAGWQQAGDEHTYRFSVLQSPQIAVDWFRNCIGSSTWDLTNEELAKGVAALEAFIEERFDDPNVPTPVEECFHVVQYLPPQN